eukprot:g6320.t1
MSFLKFLPRRTLSLSRRLSIPALFASSSSFSSLVQIDPDFTVETRRKPQFQRLTALRERLAAETDRKEEVESERTNALFDSFGRKHTYLRISLTEKCNLRCKYCMPADGIELSPQENMLTDAEILRLAELFATQGVTKIRLTGGEPLLRNGIEKLALQLKEISGINELGITTNGMLLKRKLPQLVSAGVDAINISLDTLIPAKFSFITRRSMKGLDRVLDAIKASVDAGIPSVKVNCVVVNGMNEEEIIDFVRLTKNLPIEVRFIEYMPFQANEWEQKKLVPWDTMVEEIDVQLMNEFNNKLIRLNNVDEKGAVSKTYQVEGWPGKVGFITSMSSHFCGECNRLRLTADGNLKTCLFGTDETNLRERIRCGESNDTLLPTIQKAVLRKKAVLGGYKNFMKLADQSNHNRPMIKIGG